MGVGDTVLLEMNGDKWAFIKLKRDGTAVIGKHKDVSLNPLIGAPFGSTYEVDQDGVLYPAEPDPPEWTAGDDAINAIDDDRNNADVNDMRDSSAQQLDQHDIARLKREGVGGRSLVEALAASSATFAKKTAYAQEKYVKKKLRKHLVRCRARRPTPRAVCEAYFHKQPAATNYVRYDALGMLLALGNAGAEAQPLVVETCGGLIVGAVAERLGGRGRVVAGHTGGTPPSLDIARLMNLGDAERESIATAPVTELIAARARHAAGGEGEEDEKEDSDGAADGVDKAEGDAGADGVDKGADGDKCADGDNGAEARVPRERPEGWRSRRIESASPDLIRDLATPSEGFTSLILAAPALDPATALRALLPLLAPSAPFAVWSYAAQPLAEALDELRRSSSAVNLTLQEPWLRRHQVLPRRTHPTMTTTAGSGGYVLSGNVIPEGERKRQRGDDDETALKRARTGGAD
uniref:tRNA (adenine(58)-N(1))-methyltransferase non-catalytic subunit TRM6 n=1 Tax=Micromonas pusilla TaxID=38833 RepID=A0A7S0NIX7_MICPS